MTAQQIDAKRVKHCNTIARCAHFDIVGVWLSATRKEHRRPDTRLLVCLLACSPHLLVAFQSARTREAAYEKLIEICDCAELKRRKKRMTDDEKNPNACKNANYATRRKSNRLAAHRAIYDDKNENEQKR